MKPRSIDCMLMGISVACFLLMSVSFLLMPGKSMVDLPGMFFWLGLLLGVALQIVLSVRYKASRKANGTKGEKNQKSRIGLFSFGSNVPAMIADGAMVVSLIAMVLAFVITKGYGYICYVFIATTIFSFCMHCVLNGRIYFHLNKQNRQLPVQKKVNATKKGEGEK